MLNNPLRQELTDTVTAAWRQSHRCSSNVDSDEILHARPQLVRWRTLSTEAPQPIHNRSPHGKSSAQTATELLDSSRELGVASDLLLDLGDRVNDGGVIAATEELADIDERELE